MKICGTNSNSLFFEYQKEDLLLTDGKGNKWVVLSKYADTGRQDLAKDKLMVWNWLYGYFVTDEQLNLLESMQGKRFTYLIVISVEFRKHILYIIGSIHGLAVANQC